MGFLEIINNFRLDPKFDGNEALARYYRTGRYDTNSQPDINKIRRLSEEFESDEDAINFLRNKETSSPVQTLKK